jgi:hypothetical protein
VSDASAHRRPSRTRRRGRACHGYVPPGSSLGGQAVGVARSWSCLPWLSYGRGRMARSGRSAAADSILPVEVSDAVGFSASVSCPRSWACLP